MWLTTILIVLTVALYLFYRKRKHAFQLRKRCGLSGPQPHWFFGNLGKVSNDRPLNNFIHEWTKQYGEVYGYFEGPDLTVVISDPDLVQEAFVRQFSVFNGRKRFPFQSDPNTTKRVSMFVAEGDRWKRLRTSVNPAFTEAKMRNMFPLIKHSVDAIMDQFHTASQDGNPVDVYEYFKRMTLDVIAECAFGIHLDTQHTPTNNLFVHLKYFFDIQLVKRGWMLVVAQAMPELRILIRPLRKILSWIMPDTQRGLFLLDEMNDVIALRKKNPGSRRQDILQLLLDAETEGGEAKNTGKTKSKALSVEEIQEQAMLFLFAGYETSSTALAYICHTLAFHPEVQWKLQAEIDLLYEELNEDAETSYDRLGTLSYMNNVISETLRLYPIAPAVIARRCSQTIELGKYTIPAGCNILADVYALHFNPELWGPTDPSVFDPDRFEGNQKRHPSAWVPFGIGPRFCVGQRFAMMEIRATLLRLLRHYTVKACTETEQPLRLKYGPTVTPLGEIKVFLQERNLDCASRKSSTITQS